MGLRYYLARGREVPLIRGHPWVYSGAIARQEGEAAEEEAEVFSAKGEFLGRGTHHPAADIRVRLFTTTPGQSLDAAEIGRRLALAVQRRQAWLSPAPDGAVRLVFAETDGLPGLIVDRYARTLVVQLLSSWWETRRQALVDSLCALLQPETIWERSDQESRRHESMEPRKGLLWGQPLAAPVPFREDGLHYLADVVEGHKTGFYLDQRVNRRRVRAWLRRLQQPARVLDVFAYTAAFSLGALAEDAREVVAVDSSQSARELALQQLALNRHLPADRLQYRHGDAFALLRALKAAGEQFDLVILDPPRLAPHRYHLQKSLRAYKDINLVGCQLVRPGGLLASFCCSGVGERELFGKVVEGAARDARRSLFLLEGFGQPPDHPVRLGFAESEYLKGFLFGT